MIDGVSMTVLTGIVGTLLWGISCLAAFSYLIIHDGYGYVHGNVHIISNIYELYLFCQFLCSLLSTINTFDHSTALTYIYVILMSLAAFVYMILAVLWSLGSSGYRVDIAINMILPVIYCGFLIALIFVPEENIYYPLFALYLPAACAAYASLWILYFMFKNETMIFEDIVNRKEVNTYFNWALFAGTIGMIDFLYPAFGAMGWLPDDHMILWTRICDAVLYIPFIIPLIRYLNEMNWFSKRNVIRLLKGERFHHDITVQTEPSPSY